MITLHQYLTAPGEHTLFLQGKGGALEAVLSSPANLRLNYLAILGHPHPLYGGTMQNKVVTTLVRTFNELGIPSLRFNFRGVGRSEGAYSGGSGESEDMFEVLKQLGESNASLRFCLAGFSFGSYVTFMTAAKAKQAVSLLVSVAPPVGHFNFDERDRFTGPWIIVQGEEDEVVPPQAVYEWYEALEPKPVLIKMPETTHFFHSRLGDLKEHLLKHISPFIE